MWKLPNIFKRSDPQPVRTTFDVNLSKLTAEELEDLRLRGVLVHKAEALGDGNADFLGEGTTEEFEEQEKRDKKQFGIFGIGQK